MRGVACLAAWCGVLVAAGGVGSAGAAVDVFVMEQHGHALAYWANALASPSGQAAARAALVRVDSHSGLLHAEVDGPWGLADPRGMARSQPTTGDFVTRAVYAGLVGSLHWVRSDFAGGVYNGPALGEHRVRVGHDGDHTVCFSHLDSSPASAVASESERRVEEFGDCELYAGNLMPQEQPLSVSVATLPNAARTAWAQAQVQAQARGGAPWLLDVDLDFFATQDPSLALFAKHGLDDTWVSKNFRGVYKCSPRGFGTDADDDGQLGRVVDILAGKASRTAEPRPYAKVAHKRVEKEASCKPDRGRAAELDAAMRDATTREAFRGVFVEGVRPWTDDFMHTMLSGKKSDYSPFGRPASPAVLDAQVKELEQLLRALKTRRGDPLVVTVARSERIDRHLPASLADEIQAKVLAMLANVFDTKAPVFHPDMTPPPPPPPPPETLR